jgi:predicted nucleotidyltransferase
LRAAARRAAASLPHLRRIVLFGSLAAGVPTPHSDADLLVVVSTSEVADMRQRIPAVLAALSPLPCPVDLVVLTMEEFEQRRSGDDPLLREALSKGLDLF